MRFSFSSPVIPKRAARKLSRTSLAANVGHVRSLELTAFCMGYKNWYELQQSIAAGGADELDDALSLEAREARRRYVISRLRAWLSRSRPHVTDEYLRRQVLLWSPLASDEFYEDLPAVMPPAPVSLAEARIRLTDSAYLEQERLRLAQQYLDFFENALGWRIETPRPHAAPGHLLAVTWSEKLKRRIPILSPLNALAARTGSDALLQSLCQQFGSGALLLSNSAGVAVHGGIHGWSPGWFVSMSGVAALHVNRATTSIDDALLPESGHIRLRAATDQGSWAQLMFHHGVAGVRILVDSEEDVQGDVFSDWGYEE